MAGRLTRVETGTSATLQGESVAPANWTGFTILRTAETQYAENRKLREFVLRQVKYTTEIPV